MIQKGDYIVFKNSTPERWIVLINSKKEEWLFWFSLDTWSILWTWLSWIMMFITVLIALSPFLNKKRKYKKSLNNIEKELDNNIWRIRKAKTIIENPHSNLSQEDWILMQQVFLLNGVGFELWEKFKYDILDYNSWRYYEIDKKNKIINFYKIWAEEVTKYYEWLQTNDVIWNASKEALKELLTREIDL